MIEKSHSQLSLVKVLLESAVFAYEPMVNKVRPKMGGMANKTKNKWEKFEEQAHHADLVAAFVKRLLKVHRHQVGLNGAKILCVLGFPTNNNPWKQEKKSQNEFYKRATDGGTYLAFLDT